MPAALTAIVRSTRCTVKTILLLLALATPVALCQTLKSVTPNNVPQNSAQLNVTISGSGFKGNQKVMLAGTQLSRSILSKSTIVAVVPAWMMTTPGFYSLTVGSSNALQLQVCAPLIVPGGTLPSPIVGVPYSYQLTASGGCQPNP